ncbi:MAG: hypothetical protein BJ554DRAFT_2141 [Olpidium bornovanus]|uniref:Uncharacterized protein n=1 Tax=Olpidium bornovanus TaxID=278681 RepID=A0A8H7ZQX8_9FUNG|nr:MAG: hypothetical protein BJ554DRAFT_2141 [Olpidium bornovanus]
MRRTTLPVSQSRGLDAKQAPAENALGGVSQFGKCVGLLLEVLEQLYGGGRLANGVLVRVNRPDKLESRAEALAAPGESGVDNVFAVAADDHEAAVARVLERLRVHLAVAQVLDRQGEPLAVFNVIRVRPGLYVGRLDVVVLRPDYFPAVVHRHRRLLTPELDHDCSFVVTERHVVPALLVGHAPDAAKGIFKRVLQPIGVCMPDADGSYQKCVRARSDSTSRVQVTAGRLTHRLRSLR